MPAANDGKKRAPPVSDWDFASIAELTKALRLVRLGTKVTYDSASLPNLADSARLYMRLLDAARSPRVSADGFVEAQRQRAALSPDDRSLDAERTRGGVMSHRDWLAADGAFATPAAMAHIVWRVRRSTLSVGCRSCLPARPVGTDRGAADRHRRQSISLPRCVLHMGGPGDDLRSACDRSSDRDVGFGFTHWAADHRALS